MSEKEIFEMMEEEVFSESMEDESFSERSDGETFSDMTDEEIFLDAMEEAKGGGFRNSTIRQRIKNSEITLSLYVLLLGLLVPPAFLAFEVQKPSDSPHSPVISQIQAPIKIWTSKIPMIPLILLAQLITHYFGSRLAMWLVHPAIRARERIAFLTTVAILFGMFRYVWGVHFEEFWFVFPVAFGLGAVLVSVISCVITFLSISR